ncbi:MAG: HD-GYP domain-containing protein [Conexivisphaerales archaeon]
MNDKTFRDIVLGIFARIDFELSYEDFMRRLFSSLRLFLPELQSVVFKIALDKERIGIRVDANKFVITQVTPIYPNANCVKTSFGNGNSVFFCFNQKASLDKSLVANVETVVFPVVKSFFAHKEKASMLSSTIFAFVKTMDLKDSYTKKHSENVTKYVYFFGKKLGYSKSKLKKLVLAAILHDIGKIGISRSLLNSKKILNDKERKVIMTHPEKGYYIVSSVRGLEDVAEIIKHHHERWDGSGYPDGLSYEQIPELSCVLSICDAFDAITSKRAYRRTISTLEEAKEEILKNAGSQFHPVFAVKFVSFADYIFESTKKTSFESILRECV